MKDYFLFTININYLLDLPVIALEGGFQSSEELQP